MCVLISATAISEERRGKEKKKEETRRGRGVERGAMDCSRRSRRARAVEESSLERRSSSSSSTEALLLAGHFESVVAPPRLVQLQQHVTAADGDDVLPNERPLQ